MKASELSKYSVPDVDPPALCLKKNQLINTNTRPQKIAIAEIDSTDLFYEFSLIFALRLVLIKLITAPQPQQFRTGSVRVDRPERDPLLSHLVVL